MIGDWYKNNLANDLGLRGYSFACYEEKCFTQVYRALYGVSMLVPAEGHKHGC